MLLILAELLISRGEPTRVLDGAIGATTGIFAALLMTLILSQTTAVEPTKSFLAYGCVLVFGYLGLSLGASKGHELSRDGAVYAGENRVSLKSMRIMPKLLDTSVLIDGRIAEICGAKIVTNDFNLNKVATVQGLGVLNVNQLANALRPVALPGESMRVTILREGKEAHQGVAYLEDGTMVVVDGAKRYTNKVVDIIVTSVHQTPAGKMIFGRIEEPVDTGGTMARQAAAGRGAGGGRSGDSGNSGREAK